MATVAVDNEARESAYLGRDAWFSHHAQALLQAVDDPRIGGPKMLAVLLHDGLGCSLALVAALTGQTKNVVKTQVIYGRSQIRRLSEGTL